MDSQRLEHQLEFILEIDKAKRVLRRTLLPGDLRRENDAEHAWHMALMAMLLAEYGPPDLDLLHVLKLILVHDLVEIDAGDTYIYDDQAREDQAAREQAAAARIFPILPPDQAGELHALWDGFEGRASPEARFAAALDRLQPLLLNFAAGGVSWRRHGVRRDQILERNAPIGSGAPELWTHARALIEEAVKRGYIEG